MGQPKYVDPATSTEVHGPAIADLDTGTAAAADNATAINSILAALRSANIISTT